MNTVSVTVAVPPHWAGGSIDRPVGTAAEIRQAMISAQRKAVDEIMSATNQAPFTYRQASWKMVCADGQTIRPWNAQLRIPDNAVELIFTVEYDET